MKKNVDIVLISIANPILTGVYYNGCLIDSMESNEKISDGISVIFEAINQKYNIDNILYVNSPGNYLGIKLTYIYLKTLSIVKDINIKATDGFFFNQNNPIRGIMGKFFVKNQNKIILTSIEENTHSRDFYLPKDININQFSDNIEPIYISPAIY